MHGLFSFQAASVNWPSRNSQSKENQPIVSTAFLFPGQGSQAIGMGRGAVATSSQAQALFDEADALLGFSLSTLCFEGPEDALTDTVNQQPALFVTSLAMLAALEAQGMEPPAFVAGHSLGELTALAAAGSLTFADGLALVRKRGELMKAAGEREPGRMAAILALDAQAVRDLCAQVREETGLSVQLANDNCPGQLVISGHGEAVTAVLEYAKTAGARKTVELPITIAAHSPLMGSAAEAFATAVDATSIAAPRMPVIGNVSAQPLHTADAIRTELKAQLTSPVAWQESMHYLLGQGADTFVEVGPGSVLLGLMKRINRKTKRVPVSFEE